VTDNRSGAYQATKALLDAGLRQVVYLTAPIRNSALRDRHAGYCRAMEERGFSLAVRTSQDAEAEIASGKHWAYRLTVEMLRTQEGPFAILASEAPALAEVWQALQEQECPRDRCALACFDEPFFSLPDDVRFIKVVQPLQEIGRRSVEILQGKMNAASNGDRTPVVNQIRLAPTVHLSGPFCV
jgi:LacI family transcriptional regulator